MWGLRSARPAGASEVGTTCRAWVSAAPLLALAGTASSHRRLDLVPFIQTPRGTWAEHAHQPAEGHGGKARFDEELAAVASADDTSNRGRQPLGFFRPPLAATDEELGAWAERVADKMIAQLRVAQPVLDARPPLELADSDTEGYPGDISPTGNDRVCRMDRLDDCRGLGIRRPQR